ncbi:MAG TPA: universal stress protein [Terriglobales bacterium]|nr:universal stress protein [Terriglobales bacterium]
MQTAPVISHIALSNILFATDFSGASKAALPFALALGRAYEGKIFVTRIVPYEPYLSVPLEPIPADLDMSWDRERQNMAAFVSAANFGDVAHQEILQRGELGEAISDLIVRKRIDVVVVGTHGRHGLKKFVLGSAAEKIYRQAACPVLTVGPEAAACCGRPWELKQILFATDFSDAALHGLPYALSLAEENQAKLIFFHAIPLVPHEHKAVVEMAARKRLENLMPAESWCRPDYLVVFDFPAPAITQVAREHNVDLIVMGVGKPAVAALQSHLPWSVASDVVSTAPCPVLITRQ